MAWDSSDRRQRLPSNWPAIRDRVLGRDKTCTCRGCDRCTPAGCVRDANEVDHVIPGDDHSDDNLRGLCRTCHLLKSSREGSAALERQRAQRFRPREPHPGLRRGGG